MIHQTNLYFDERGNNTKTVLVMAPTGKAALNASGVTLHSNNGLSIPILSLGKGNDLKGDVLLRLQQRFQHISAIIIDERWTSTGLIGVVVKLRSNLINHYLEAYQ